MLKRFDEVLHELEQERQRVDEGLRDALRPGSYVSRGCDLLLGRLLLFFCTLLRKRRVMMPKDLVLRLLRVLRGLILLRTLSRNPLVALQTSSRSTRRIGGAGAAEDDRKTRRKVITKGTPDRGK